MEQIIGRFDALSAAVERATRKKVEARKEEARLRAQQIEDDAREKADQIHEEILTKAQQQAEERRRQRVAEANQEARQRHLAAREELIDQVWDQAERELRQLVGSDNYAKVLRQLTWQAVETLGPGYLILTADPAGHEILSEERLSAWSKAASEAFEATVEFERSPDPSDTWGGLIVTTNSGRKQVDARFDERLEIGRSEIREDVFNALMGES